MTTYYVGTGGNNANNGTTWALRKLTLNGAEDIPVVAGDTVYVGPGTYRETLTVDVSGSAGSPVTYIGDYTGANTDGVGGVVRITGSDNDQTAARANCITATSKNYRTFRGFEMGHCSAAALLTATECTNWTMDACIVQNAASHALHFVGSLGNITVSKCSLTPGTDGTACVRFEHSTEVDNSGCIVENCILTLGHGVEIRKVGGITVRNCLLAYSGGRGVWVAAALTAGQSVTVNNCILTNCVVSSFQAVNLGEIVENYNAVFLCGARSNVATGANSNTYPPLFDTRWFFEAVNGGSMVTPFDLASYSQLVNVAGTSPTTTDMRGTSAIGGTREWGALEYDPNLDIEAGSGGGGAVSISPFRGNIG